MFISSKSHTYSNVTFCLSTDQIIFGLKLHDHSLKDAWQSCWFAYADLYYLSVSSISLYNSYEFAVLDGQALGEAGRELDHKSIFCH